MVDIVPDDDVVDTGSDGATYGEDELRVESGPQHVAHLATFSIVWKISSTRGSVKWLSRIVMGVLNLSNKQVQ